MKITGLEALTVPHGRGHVIVVVVDTDEGLYGLGEVGIRSRQPAVLAAVRQMGEMLVGADASRIEHLWQLLYRGGFFPLGRYLSAALSAVDIALWDLRGQACGVPVYELLGGATRDYVTCYTHVDTGRGIGATLERCDELVAAGWRHLRIGLPLDTPADPRAAVRDGVRLFEAMRSHVGEDVELILDVHTRLDPPEALMLCRELEPTRPFFVEDPLRCEAPDAYRQLRARTGVPLAAGEQFGSKWEFRPLIDADLIDHARADLCVVGGITEARKLAGWCEAHYIAMATHNPLGPVATAATTHFNLACSNVSVQESGSSADNPLFSDTVEIRGGQARPPQRPGLGIRIDRAAARRAAAAEADTEPPLLRRHDGAVTNW